jgi:hypothetical protein
MTKNMILKFENIGEIYKKSEFFLLYVTIVLDSHFKLKHVKFHFNDLFDDSKHNC